MITIVDVERAADSDISHQKSVVYVTPGEFLKRAVAARLIVSDDYQFEAAMAKRMLENAGIAAKLAKAQGTPLTPETTEEMLKKRRKSQVTVPALFDTANPTATSARPSELLLSGIQLSERTE